MVLPLRAIPPLAKEAFRRKTPFPVLMEALKRTNLTFPMQQQFLARFEQNNMNTLNALQQQHQQQSMMKVETMRPSGFEPPLGGTEHLPFHVERTKSGSLPVYIDYRNGRTKAVTIVRKVSGDMQAVQMELSKIVGQEARLRAGSIEIKGNHTRIVRLWLRALGF